MEEIDGFVAADWAAVEESEASFVDRNGNKIFARFGRGSDQGRQVYIHAHEVDHAQVREYEQMRA